jgi:hypothetical protein
MSELAIGKRILQFISDEPEEHWRHSCKTLDRDIDYYAEKRATGFLIESIASAQEAVEQIDKHVEEHKIQAAIVDYAQILHGSGKTPYERVTNTSILLKQVCAKHGITLLLLCQLSREIEKRPKFVPQMSDIKDTGQLEQDADVITFLVWPHKIKPSNPAQEYMIFVAKNRNRAINQAALKMRFVPSRQMLLPEPPQNRERTFDDFNSRESVSEREF